MTASGFGTPLPLPPSAEAAGPKMLTCAGNMRLTRNPGTKSGTHSATTIDAAPTRRPAEASARTSEVLGRPGARLMPFRL